MTSPTRPATRAGFEVAIVCALSIEADAVIALFDRDWDEEGEPFDKAPGDPNSYSTGSLSRHNVVLAHMPGMGKSSAAAVASSFRSSFPNIKLALLVGICGIVPTSPETGEEIFLGDVVLSAGVIQYDFGRRFPEHFKVKDTLLDFMGRPNPEIRGILAKLRGIRARKKLGDKMAGYLRHLQEDLELKAAFPGARHDQLFKSTYRHLRDGSLCTECGCDLDELSRRRPEQDDVSQPMPRFGLVASGDTVMKSGEDRDRIAKEKTIVAFEMEGAGIWDVFPCVVIKGACDYADSHKTKKWQRYAAATAAACAKAFLDNWTPSNTLQQPAPHAVTVTATPPTAAAEPPCLFLVPFQRNNKFTGRTQVLQILREMLFDEASSPCLALVGLGGMGKTQIALQIAYWVRDTKPQWSVFWLPVLSMVGFEKACADLARELQIYQPGQEDPRTSVKKYLESSRSGDWLLIVDNADDEKIISGVAGSSGVSDYLPQSTRGRILFTTRSTDVAMTAADGEIVDLEKMSEKDAWDLLLKLLPAAKSQPDDVVTAALKKLTYLPLAISQAAAYIKRNKIQISRYLSIVQAFDEEAIGLLSREFPDKTRYPESRHAVATTWLVSFNQIQEVDPQAADLLSFMSQIEPRAIPEKMLPRTGTEEELITAVGTLCGYAFLQRRQEDGEMLDMHSLVHLAARQWVQQGGNTPVVRHTALAHLKTVFRSARWEDRETWRQYMPHVLQIIHHDEPTKKWSPEECDLGHWAGRCLRVEGAIPGTVALLEHVVRDREQTLPENHHDLLSSQHYLAEAYRANGQIRDAIELLQHVVTVREKRLPEDHPARLASQHGLAGAYRANGQIRDAIELLQHVVRVREATLPENHSERLASQHQLAGAYRSNGQIRDAIELVQHVVRVKQALPEDHPSRLTSQHELAVAYRSDGRIEDAIELLKYVVDRRNQTLDPSHPDRLGSQSQLAWAYSDNGQGQEAIELMANVVEIESRTLDPNHPSRRRHERYLAKLKDAHAEQGPAVSDRMLGGGGGLK